MGDRVWACVAIGGHLDTIEEAEELIDAIIEEHVIDQEEDTRVENEEQAIYFLRKAIEGGMPLDFYDNDVNYGNFENIDAHIGMSPKLWATTNFDAGGEFPAGRKTIANRDGTQVESTVWVSDGSVIITLGELEEALHKTRLDADPLAGIDELIANRKLDAGIGLPPLTASPAVSAWLKIFAEAA